MLQRIDFAALARHLLERGYTTKRLGVEIGLSQPAVSRLAAGRTKDVSAAAGVALIRLAGGDVHVPELKDGAPVDSESATASP